MKFALLFLCSYLPTLVIAETEKVSVNPISSDYMSKLLLSLGLVVVVIFALAWLVKRFNFIPQQNQGLIKIISTLSVGSRERLALIQVGEEQLLVALSPGNISKLHCLKKPVQTVDEAKSSFKNKFDSLVDKQTQESPSSGTKNG